MKNKIITLIFLSFILNGFVWVAHAWTVEEALNIAFGGPDIEQPTPPDPTVVAESVAQGMVQRAQLVEKYVAEIRASNPSLSEGDIYAAATSRATSDIQSSQPVNMLVSEKVPWATCTCAAKGYEWQADCPSTLAVGEKLYQCSVWKGMTAFQGMIASITKWFVYLTMLFWVLALVWAGILWAWGSESEEYTKKAKWWAVNIMIWLALLFTFRYILWFLAPWIFQ
jgi:hypothetical protein